MTDTTQWVLFDGAMLHESPEREWLMAHPRCRAMYDDLGEEAQAVGPILLPLCAEVQPLVSGLSGTKRFACATLVCRERTDVLVRHLQALRYVYSGESAFYFRYADHRAFDAVVVALTPGQRNVLLGPIESWHYLARNGHATALAPGWHDEALQDLPLRLLPEQWRRILQSTRVGELYEATSSVAEGAHPPCLGNDAERYAWTEKTERLLRRLRVDDLPARLAANLAMWQTAGQLGDEPAFHHTLEEVQAGDDLERVFALGRLGPFKGGYERSR